MESEEKLRYEYDKLLSLEQETTKIRHTTFTALVSISFILPGLAIKTSVNTIITPLGEYQISQFVFYLGFLFFCFATFHYHWYHRYSHRYRSGLKNLEAKLNISVYRLRKRPTIRNFKFHFHWSLYIIGVLYGTITAVYIGFRIFLILSSFVVLTYLALLLLSFSQQEEPLE